MIGPNGSGKSNFIGVFSFLQAICEERLHDYVARAGGADKILHFGSKVTETLAISIDFSFQHKYHGYSVVLIPTSSDELRLRPDEMRLRAEIFFDGGQNKVKLSERLSDPAISLDIRSHLQNWRVYHFHDTSANAPIKKTADVNDNRFLRADGANLAAFLYYLREKHSNSYGLIRRSVQRVAPFFDDFVLEPQLLNPEKIRLEWRHKDSDAYFDVSSLSDGTLRFIALATLFLQPAEHLPSVILVDEPELGLHPYAITLLTFGASLSACLK